MMPSSKRASDDTDGDSALKRLRPVTTLAPALVTKMLTCIIGDVDGTFVHIAPPTTSDDSLLVLGLYPNANADIKRVGATETEMHARF
mmetsp:Transcript_36222/g.89953  ORF Transcript_36222/g.89953 Transcript_36222/m.89953 type:complete len:88 (-) Transcript_36222:157-420(-)